MRLSVPVGIACSILFVSPCLAQNGVGARIDALVKAEMRQQKIPGMAVAVLREGRPVVMKGYGLANVEHNVPVTPATIFQSGSIGKQFTAAGIVSLADAGKLSLDDTLSRFFPDSPESWTRITIRQMLTHTSGMADYQESFDMRRDYTEDELLAMVKATPLAFQPGDDWMYSNLAYVTLGILMNKVTGKYWGEVLEERIFAPIGMSSTTVISESEIVPNRAAGYRLVAGKLANHNWVAPSINTTADGALYTTVQDLAKWDAALYTDTPIKRTSRELIWTPARGNQGQAFHYGFGWHVETMRGHRTVHHGGAWQGFQTYILRFPDEKLTIIFLTNLAQAHPTKLARGLTSVFLPEFAMPREKKIEDLDPKVTSLVKRTLFALSEGRADSAVFTPGMRAEFFPTHAVQVREQLSVLSLPVAVIGFSELVDRRDEGDQRVYRYMLTDIGRTIFATVALNRDDKIVRLTVETKP